MKPDPKRPDRHIDPETGIWPMRDALFHARQYLQDGARYERLKGGR